MSVGMILSSLALGVSLIFSATKFFHWLLHSEPRSILWVGRWLLIAVAAASVPGVVALLAHEQWTMAMMLGSGVIAAPALFTWRTILPRVGFGRGRAPNDPNGGFRRRAASSDSDPDPDLVREAADVLERYLIQTGALSDLARDTPARARFEPENRTAEAPMDTEEARAVLGLEADASAATIRNAHRNLMQRVHPDRGGSNYLAAKTNRAKDVLLAELRDKAPPPARRTGRSSASRPASKGAKA